MVERIDKWATAVGVGRSEAMRPLVEGAKGRPSSQQMTVTSRSNREMLEQFGLLADEDLAALLGLSVKSLKNRPRHQLPEIVKVGRRRFYKEASVREWLGLPEKPDVVPKAAPPPPPPTAKAQPPYRGYSPCLGPIEAAREHARPADGGKPVQ
jgi:hypothetical protein